ncbi:MAG: zinc ribbon domain-containing protein [Oribacterium sp.]|nr:zinc ribbon domain-containing protein [Oribacterium sp.]
MAGFCRKCGSPLGEGAMFCKKCGTQVVSIQNSQPGENQVQPPKNQCRKCGNPLKDGAMFCNKCGTRVGMNHSDASKIQPAISTEPNTQRNSSPNIRPSRGGWFAPIAVFLAIVLLGNGILIRYAELKYPRLYPPTRGTGEISADSSSNGGTYGNEINGRSQHGNVNNGVEISHVNEDDLPPITLGNSKAFSITPVPGMTVSAPENSLDYDREFKVKECSEEQYEKYIEELEADRDTVLLKAFEIDAGMGPDEYLPGRYEVKFDLAEFGIPETLYEGIKAYRVDDNGNYFEYVTELEGSVLCYKSSQNSVVVLGMTFTTIYHAVGIIGTFVGVACYAGYSWLRAKEKIYYEDKKTITLEKIGKFSLTWAEEDLVARGIPGGQYELMQKITERVKILLAETKEEVRKTTWPLTSKRQIETARILQDKINSDKDIASWRGNLPDVMLKMFDQVDAAVSYIENEEKMSMPPYQVRFLVQNNVGAEAKADKMIFEDRAVYVGLDDFYKGDPAKKMEISSAKFAHEFSHICQFEYHLNAPVIPSNVKLAEASATLVEDQAFDYFSAKGKMPLFAGMSKDVLHKDEYLTSWDYPENLADPLDHNDLHGLFTGYELAKFLQYLFKEKGKISMDRLYKSYCLGRDFSTTIKKAYGLYDFEFDKLYTDFLRDECKNKLPKSFVYYPGGQYLWGKGSVNEKKGKYETEVRDNYYMRPHILTLTGKLAEAPYAVLIVPYYSDDTLEITGHHETRIVGRNDEAYIGGVYNKLFYPPCDDNQVNLAEIVGNNVFGTIGTYVMFIAKPDPASVQVDVENIKIMMPDYPDWFTKTFNDDFGLKGEIKLRIVRDDGKEFKEYVSLDAFGQEVDLNLKYYISDLNLKEGELPDFKVFVSTSLKYEEEEYLGPESDESKNIEVEDAFEFVLIPKYLCEYKDGIAIHNKSWDSFDYYTSQPSERDKQSVKMAAGTAWLLRKSEDGTKILYMGQGGMVGTMAYLPSLPDGNGVYDSKKKIFNTTNGRIFDSAAERVIEDILEDEGANPISDEFYELHKKRVAQDPSLNNLDVTIDFVNKTATWGSYEFIVLTGEDILRDSKGRIEMTYLMDPDTRESIK